MRTASAEAASSYKTFGATKHSPNKQLPPPPPMSIEQMFMMQTQTVQAIG
jgi:hypothetical protein